MQRDLAELTSHIVVCGSGRAALYAVAELNSVLRTGVLIVPDEHAAARARAELPEVRIVVGSATDDEVLLAAGVDRAAGLIACTDSDNENVVVTLAARQVNPNVRIISQVEDVDHESKIKKVGADSVVSPDLIGGMRMASELIRPSVVSFLDTMLRDQDMNLRVEEIRIPEGSPAVGKQFKDLGLSGLPGILLVATRSVGGELVYNPLRSRSVTAGMVLIFMGSPVDSRSLCDQLGGEMLATPAAG
jgi:voltage-gated potassium channel